MKIKFSLSLNSLKLIYEFALIVPILSVLFSTIIYYTTWRFKKGRIRTISETVVYFPENKIFAFSMSIDCILLAIIFSIRQKIIRKLAKKQDLTENKSYKMSMKISQTLILLSSLGLLFLSNITLKDSRNLHLISALNFFFGIILYLLISDYWAKRVGYNISLFSYLIPYSALAMASIFTIITIFFSRNRFIYSIGSIIEYFCSFLIYMKIYLIHVETPSQKKLKAEKQSNSAMV